MSIGTEGSRCANLETLQAELTRLRNLQLQMAFEFSALSRELMFQKERISGVETMVAEVESLLSNCAQKGCVKCGEDSAGALLGAGSGSSRQVQRRREASGFRKLSGHVERPGSTSVS